MKLCSADLRNPVEIQRSTSEDDGAGGSIVRWDAIGTIWCAIKDLSGGEALEQGRVIVKTTTRFTCRYWEDVAATDRLAFDGLIYAIRFVNNEDFRDVATIIEAESGVPDSQVVPVVENPTIAPGAGSYETSATVTLATVTPGASIRYTIDGSDPSETVGTLYSAPFTLTASAEVRAIAYASGVFSSDIVSAAFEIITAAPEMTPAGGPFVSSVSVAITSDTPGASIRYTTDGSAPSPTVGTVYAGPVTVAASLTLRAIAYKAGQTASGITVEPYVLGVAVPVATPPGGSYSGPQFVALATATAGATIRYTIDGTTPSEASGIVYTVPFTIPESLAMRAIAYKSGLTSSAVIVESYSLPDAIFWGLSENVQALAIAGDRNVEPYTVTP
jgi:SPP1 family predicted phage head-tail adaptor